MSDTRRGKKPIGEWLVAEGLITQAQLLEALASRMVVDGRRERLGETLERLGFVEEYELSRTLAKQHGLEFANTDLPAHHSGARDSVPENIARRHQIVPLWSENDGTLVVLTNDPTDIVAMDDIRLAAGAVRIRPIVAPVDRIAEALNAVYVADAGRAGDLLDQVVSETQDEAPEDITDSVEETGPVIRLAEQIIHDAVHGYASDIHIEPGRDSSRVRYRIDGVLHEVMTLPTKAHAPLISRLKLVARLDIAERRRPQDGRSTFRAPSGEVDLRVSTIPVLHGEKMVMRLLRKGAEMLRLDEIGLSVQQYDGVIANIERPQGLVLLTGPTGAGKTSTLYSFLDHLSDVRSNLITVEDPVEYELPGVNQTQINSRIGFTFSTALRTVLRQDPDIVMVGEIRDLETAELAMQASLTGHMVFSTLHTNDAPGAVTRLADLGIANYLIASSLTMVVAQRLARRLCNKCAAPHTPTEREIDRLNLSPEDMVFEGYRSAVGCRNCSNTGYKGRIAIMQILTVDHAVKALAMSGDMNEDEIAHAARMGGMLSLREDGLVKARQGITSLTEIIRTTPTDLFAEQARIRGPVAAPVAAKEHTYTPEVLEYVEPERPQEVDAPRFDRVDVAELDQIIDDEDPALWSDVVIPADARGVTEVRGGDVTVDLPVQVEVVAAGVAAAPAPSPALARLERLLDDIS